MPPPLASRLRTAGLVVFVSAGSAWAGRTQTSAETLKQDPTQERRPTFLNLSLDDVETEFTERTEIAKQVHQAIGTGNDFVTAQRYADLSGLGLTAEQLQAFNGNLPLIAGDLRNPDRLMGIGPRLDALAVELGPGGENLVREFYVNNLLPLMDSLPPMPVDKPTANTLPAPHTSLSDRTLTVLAQGGPTTQGIAAEQYANQGKHDKAVALASQAIKGGNKDPGVLLVRGQAAEKLHDFQLANSDARRVLALEPDNKPAHSLYMLTRDRPSTVRLLDADGLAADGGKLGAAGLDRARPGWDDGEPGSLTAAQIAAQENAALGHRPSDAQSARLTEDAKRALQVGDFASALRLTAEALRVEPRNATAHYVRATALLQSGDAAGAEREASAGLALAPDNGALLYTRAVAYGRQKVWESAYKDADAVVRKAPRSGHGYQARAGVNWGLGRREAMLTDLRAAAGLDPRYQADLQRAVQQPEDIDPTLLFGGAPAAASPAAAPSRGPRYALWAAGAALAGLGVLPILFPAVRRQITTVLRRGPAVDDAAAPAVGGAEEAPPGFWRRYEVVREIGAGGMGVVYEAWDKNLERRVAVKRMRDEIRNDRRERERFLQEARTVAQMRHPNLVEIYSIEEDGDDAYLVFEFVDGKTLHELIAEKGSLPPAEAVALFRGLSAGVDYAHRRGIIHRDLKPANVIVEADGAVKIMDFGVARQAQDALLRQALTNTVIGTPPYMAPEQEQGVVCAQSDVYALGVCLYEALTGVLPFQGTAGAVLLAKMAARYEPLAVRAPGLPPGLAKVVDRALDPKPETRIQSAAELQKELEAALQPSRAL